MHLALCSFNLAALLLTYSTQTFYLNCYRSRGFPILSALLIVSKSFLIGSGHLPAKSLSPPDFLIWSNWKTKKATIKYQKGGIVHDKLARMDFTSVHLMQFLIWTLVSSWQFLAVKSTSKPSWTERESKISSEGGSFCINVLFAVNK